MTALASTLPSHDGYVAAAYIVFFALILIYVAIMAARLGRVERRLRELQGARKAPLGGGAQEEALTSTDGAEREREAV